MVNRHLSAAAILICAALSARAETADQQVSQSTNTAAINIDAISLATGAIAGNIEYLITAKHGFMLEGGYGLWNIEGGWGSAHYRYHYKTKPTHTGLSTPFWGPFIYYGNTTSPYTDPTTGDNFRMKLEILSAGANWGRRWVWSNSLNVAFRVGYGIPFIAKLNWTPSEPDQAKLISTVTKIGAGIDAEFTAGVAF